jgi:hypothetical protein
MTLEGIAKARREAERFLAATAEVERAGRANPMLFYGSPSTAALRRASMDLTRALADMRSRT